MVTLGVDPALSAVAAQRFDDGCRRCVKSSDVRVEGLPDAGGWL